MPAQTGRAALAGVIGYPVTHSLSPAIHEYWLAQYGIDGAYIPLSIQPGKLEYSINLLINMGFKGANVTLPHKGAAYRLASEHDILAEKTNAVNTLLFKENGIYGKNTDVTGFIAPLKNMEPMPSKDSNIVILGAGGATRGIAIGLLEEGYRQLTICNRTEKKSIELIDYLRNLYPGASLQSAAWEDRQKALLQAVMLVNTTQLGMKEQPSLEIDLSVMQKNAVIYDIVYTPLRTELITQAESLELFSINGLDMLLHQAVDGFEAWYGVRPNVTTELYKYIATMVEES